uniref:Putative plant transposon protein domain-containing protein n=1 Tax=Solanum tuberosum TaxID=4113 RepID=M1CJJ9_SOLTU
MIERPPYRDIRPTLCGVNSVARWDRVRDTGRHLTLHYGHFNLKARIWLKIVCSTLLPFAPTSNKKFYASGKKCSWWMQDKGLPVNVGAILKQNMLKFRTNKRCHLYYGSIITRYLRALQIEEEVHDVSPPPPLRAPHLVCRLVDVTRTKAHDPSQGPVLTIIDRQAPEDSWLGRMFGMAELQLQIGGRQVTEDEMATLAERYLLMDSAMYMCRMGPAFQEPIDDDDATSDEEDGSVEDESDDTGPRDDDTDTGDGDGNAASMDIDFSTNVATR